MSKKRIAELENELAELRAVEEEKKTRKFVTCGRCGKKTQIRKVTYLQTYWYEGPVSCMAGDTWHAGEGQFLCPKCETRNRLLSDEAKKNIGSLKCYFGKVEDVYEKNERYPFVNL